MGKPTKKAMREAMTPLRKAMERAICARMRGERVTYPEPVSFAGLTISATWVRRARVVCNVPAPYNVAEVWWSVEHPTRGKIITHAPTGQFLVDALFHAARRDPTLFEAANA